MIRILADMPGDAERINAAIGGAGRLLDVARGFNADDADIDCLIVGCRRQCPREMLELLREIERKMPWVPVILFQQFRESATEPATLNRLLGALVIPRAHQLRDLGLDWKAVGARLGLHRSTLNRKARTWPGCALTELERIGADQLVAAFVTEHVGPLFP
ncbi:SGNH/GDSL hydrolase family protein [Candidatus Palauibacter sp.]|uniref:SGNH/GDSL hydrolase family protein n=1 Tax=Candidatus Palauibacter sp. TaxID=3101350 RepID=UPI003B5BEF9E